jgi:hypothetical protein
MNKKINEVIFIYKGQSKPLQSFTILTEKVIQLVRKLYVLPNTIEIQFENMGKNIYGMTMLDPRFPNRIRLNQDLSITEYVLPLTHELIHLHQIFTNRLQCRSGGRILWENTVYKVNMLEMSYNDYQQLPWELDVVEKQQKLLKLLQENSRKLKAL